MSRQTTREIALDVLLKIEKQHAYSQLLLNETLEQSGLNQKDKALLTQLVYGVLQRKLTLDYYLQTFVQRNRKIDLWVKQLLYLSIYQKAFLDKIPDHAIVNEAATIAGKRGHRGVVGFVNGILRQMLRQGLPDLSAIEPENRRLSIAYSHPEWLMGRWIDTFGKAEAIKICQANNRPPKVTVRVNRLKTDPQALIETLAAEGIAAEPGLLSQDAVVILGGHVVNTDAYSQGLFTIQDESSMLVAQAVDPKPGMTVLDACAGPGGKTTHLAEKMANQGVIHALDLHEHKARLIDQQAERSGVSIISTKVLDARQVEREYQPASFDRILVDAPCTGFGVIRRKPEIKWEKTAEDVENISVVQKGILQYTAHLLKPGGKLIYSTCTIDRTENHEVILNFLKENPEFELDDSLLKSLPPRVVDEGLWEEDAMLQILPYQFESDGFFISCIKRKTSN